MSKVHAEFCSNVPQGMGGTSGSRRLYFFFFSCFSNALPVWEITRDFTGSESGVMKCRLKVPGTSNKRWRCSASVAPRNKYSANHHSLLSSRQQPEPLSIILFTISSEATPFPHPLPTPCTRTYTHPRQSDPRLFISNEREDKAQTVGITH